MSLSFRDDLQARPMWGKVALVTGASSGIGRATAARFAREGASVVLAARREEEGEEAARRIRRDGGEATFVRADVSQASEVEALVERCVARYGRLDYALNNAGIVGRMVPLVEYDEADWDAVLDANLKGVWLCLKYESRQLLAAGRGGAIVNTSSVGGHIGFPGLAHYCAAKHGILGLTKTAAMELAPSNIRVNAVSPGLIDTPMADRFTGGPETEAERFFLSLKPLRRRGTPEEVAEAVVWLCSDAAAFVTGHALAVDGGFLTI
jgi:NAD(P)-dependent dehydrogenase (short-subunit alcohol dehydrogenase family)